MRNPQPWFRLVDIANGYSSFGVCFDLFTAPLSVYLGAKHTRLESLHALSTIRAKKTAEIAGRKIFFVLYASLFARNTKYQSSFQKKIREYDSHIGNWRLSAHIDWHRLAARLTPQAVPMENNGQ